MKMIRAALFIALLSINTGLVGDTHSTPEWALSYADSKEADWSTDWFLEGRKATVERNADGLYFAAGPIEGDHASHAVLWTLRDYNLPIRVTFTYTRLDTIDRNVNILYLAASGLGTIDSPIDIYESRHLREIPKMSHYFKEMNAYHISFAAWQPFGRNLSRGPANYLRARQYPMDDQPGGFARTDLGKLYQDTGLFKPGVPYEIEAVAYSEGIVMSVSGDGRDERFVWSLVGRSELSNGKVGIRHMFARAARYQNFKIWTKNKAGEPLKNKGVSSR